MAADSAPQAEGSSGGTIFGIPYLYAGLGVAGVILVILYLRRQSGGGASQPLSGSPVVDANTGLPVQGVAIDPNTGTPIDPATGLGYLSGLGGGGATNTLAGWITAAENGLKGLGYAPSLISQALYDYTNGNQLSTAEAGVIDKALGTVGYPPNLLPFFGPVPSGNVPNHPIVTTPKPTTIPQSLQNAADNLRRQVGKTAAKGAPPKKIADTVLVSILKGRTKLPSGVVAPAGYKLGKDGYLAPVKVPAKKAA